MARLFCCIIVIVILKSRKFNDLFFNERFMKLAQLPTSMNISIQRLASILANTKGSIKWDPKTSVGHILNT